MLRENTNRLSQSRKSQSSSRKGLFIKSVLARTNPALLIAQAVLRELERYSKEYQENEKYYAWQFCYCTPDGSESRPYLKR
jgi:hypothetical protein